MALPLRRDRSQYFRYCPSPQQLMFHVARDFYTYRAAFCGKGAGKTIAGLAEALIYARKYPGSVGYIFSPTYPMIRRNIFPTLRTPYLLGDPIDANPLFESYSKSDNCLKFKNGSEWWFVSLDFPERAEGANIDYAYIDEARLIRGFDLAWLSVISRLRGAGRCKVKIPHGVWVTTTPNEPGSALWRIFEGPERLPNARPFRWSIFDNPKLSKAFIDDMVKSNTGGYAERFIYGRFSAVGIGMLPFDYTKHVFYDPPPIKYMRYGVDFGWSAPSAIVAVGFDYDDRAYVLDEFYQTEATTQRLIFTAKELVEKYGAGPFVCDRELPEAIYHLKASGLDAKGYENLKREDSLRKLANRLSIQSDGKPRLYVHNSCVNVISELQLFSGKENENDHTIDALRYALEGKQKAMPSVSYGTI